MTTQVIFKIDKKLKDQAMQKAQSEGLPFGVVLKLATKAYVDGTLSVGLAPKEVFNAGTRKRVRAALSDIKNRKNLSRKFDSAKDALSFLRK